MARLLRPRKFDWMRAAAVCSRTPLTSWASAMLLRPLRRLLQLVVLGPESDEQHVLAGERFGHAAAAAAAAAAGAVAWGGS